MNLTRAVELLNQKGLPYELIEYSCEDDFLKHISEFRDIQDASQSKTIALVIKSRNNHKNIELQFNEFKNDYLFRELWFGEYSFEAFDYEPEFIEKELFDNIQKIMSNYMIAVSLNDLKNRRWISDGLLENDDMYLKKFKHKMFKPKSFWGKIFKSQKQYEIYDWNTYQIIVK